MPYSFSNNSYGPDRDLILNKAGNVWHDHRRWCLQLRHCLQAIIARGQNGKWTEKVLYSFPDNTVFSFSSHGRLAFDTTGTLYGTTSNAGDTSCSDGCGNVFELTPHANGKWTGKVLYNFISNGQDGYYPSADVTLDKTSSLYETTSAGGAVSVCLEFGGCGTLFELIPRIRLGFRPLKPT